MQKSLLKPDCFSLTLHSSWDSACCLFTGKNPGPVFQFIAYQLPSLDLGFPTSSLCTAAISFLGLEVPFTAYSHSLFTISRLGPLGPVMLHKLCGFDARMGETGWIACSWVTGDNAPLLLPRDAISVVPTVCFHCTVDAGAPASVRTEFG